jgi:hypothetical protein
MRAFRAVRAVTSVEVVAGSGRSFASSPRFLCLNQGLRIRATVPRGKGGERYFSYSRVQAGAAEAV